MYSGPSNLPAPFRLSRYRSGSMFFWGQQSTLTSSSQDSSPLLLRIGPPHPSETSILPSGSVRPPNSSSPMVTGPSPGMPPSLPSSALSPIEPWNCKSSRNTSFNFLVPFPTHSRKSLTWTRQSFVGEVKHIKLADIGWFCHLEARYLQDDGAANQASPCKEKESGQLNRQSNEVCQRWNSGVCNRRALECQFRHLCSKCRGNHPSMECPKKD
jgi:hypothetical protein